MAAKEDLTSDNGLGENDQPEKENISIVDAAFNTDLILSEKTPQVNAETLVKEKDLNTAIDPTLAKEENLTRKPIYFEDVVHSIESGFPTNRPLERVAFPHPRNWLGPRFLAIWSFPIIVISQISKFLTSTNPVRPYKDSKNTITQAETIFTATQRVFQGSSSMKFFGPLFLSIWVLPLALTGTVMEILFVGPLKDTNPFG